MVGSAIACVVPACTCFIAACSFVAIAFVGVERLFVGFVVGQASTVGVVIVGVSITQEQVASFSS